MGPIICATRGGEASRRTQELAIQLAKERGSELIFLCVMETGFAGSVGDRLEEALREELQRLGRSLLGIAQARARDQGVNARTIVCQGPVQKSIETHLRELEASTLVIGVTRSESDGDEFKTEEIKRFSKALSDSTGVEVIAVT
jgi:nucleotide-binding universal stress UspA family protein